ncbi:MAG: FHA domain-containing protein, partial [Pseudomonadota bacterium]
FDLDINTAFALIKNTTKPTATSYTLAEHIAPIVEMLDIAAGGTGEFSKRPFMKAHISPVISPMRFGDDAVDDEPGLSDAAEIEEAPESAEEEPALEETLSTDEAWDEGTEIEEEVDAPVDLTRIEDTVAEEPAAPEPVEAKVRELDLAEEPEAPSEDPTEIAEAAAPAPRRAGRVKTRLLGFQSKTPGQDVFEGKAAEGAGPVRFPVGWLVVTKGEGFGHSFSLLSGVSKIGRGEDQAVKLDFGDTAISRDNHAAIAFDEELNQFFLGHGGKSNVVRLNGKPVLSTEELFDGDEIRIGETTLKFIALCGEEFTWAQTEGNGSEHAASA